MNPAEEPNPCGFFARACIHGQKISLGLTQGGGRLLVSQDLPWKKVFCVRVVKKVVAHQPSVWLFPAVAI